MTLTNFQPGGALTEKHARVYIQRNADLSVLAHLKAMNYVLVIEPRQQGKTSLVNYLSRYGAMADAVFIHVDMTAFDRSSEAIWYTTLSRRISRQLGKTLCPMPELPAPSNCVAWRDYLCELASLGCDRERRIIVALDEIGAVTFPGSTEFFSVLRDVYNSRQVEPEFEQLAFLLVGAFDPRKLISDDKVSPFNIAQGVCLPDFELAQVRELVSKGNWTADQAINLAKRIHFWTDGQPYLTQLVCAHLGAEADAVDVDQQIERLRREDENHLPPVLERLRQDERLLKYVKRIHAGERIRFYPRENRHQAELELLGVVKADEEGYCRIRNRIYELTLFPQDDPTSTRYILVKKDATTMNTPRELVEQMHKGNVILFCGAGISISKDGIPSGSQLARELAQRANLGDVGSMPLPEAAQAYELERGMQSLIAYVTERVDDPRYSPLRTHHLIAALPFKRIITTNWDNLLEEALRQARKPFVKVVRDEGISYADDDKALLIKLHGSAEQKDTIVITGDDYYDVFARLPQVANLVQSFFATKTLLFLGYGLADEDFKRLYMEVVRHLGKHKRRAYAVQLNPTPLTVKYWEQKNVQVIAADATAFLESLAAELGAQNPPPVPGATGMQPLTGAAPTAPMPTPASAPRGRSQSAGHFSLERGLQVMKDALRGSDAEILLEFSTLESRLLENIRSERLYGSTETVRSERARIVQELNRIALECLGRTFNEACGG